MKKITINDDLLVEDVKEFRPPAVSFTKQELLMILARFYKTRQTKTWIAWDSYMNGSKTNPYPLSNELLATILNDTGTGMDSLSKNEKWDKVMEMAGETLAAFQHTKNMSVVETKEWLSKEIGKISTIHMFENYKELFKGTKREFNTLKHEVELRDKVRLLTSDRILKIFGSWNEARQLIGGYDTPNKTGIRKSYTDEQLISILKEYGHKYETLADMKEDFQQMGLPAIPTFYIRLGKDIIKAYTPNLSSHWFQNLKEDEMQ